MAAEDGQALVRGHLVLPPGVVPAAGAVACVRLVDVTLADAPAVLVDEQRIGGLAAALGGGALLAFALRCPAPDPRASYGVQAHVDADGRGDGRVRPGDLVSTRSHPAITFGHPLEVEVPLAVVR